MRARREWDLDSGTASQGVNVATDAQILTAAREVAEANAAKKAAELARLAADKAFQTTNENYNETIKRVALAERHLLELSRPTPTEPAPSFPPRPTEVPNEKLEIVSVTNDELVVVGPADAFQKLPSKSKQQRTAAGG